MLAGLTALLSPAERMRAEARPDDLGRRRFLADHGWRRRLLADWLGCTPAEIAYTLGAHGKPEVVGGGVSFSASRSGAIALFAVSAAAEVGVDLERIDPNRDLEALARRLLTPNEQAAWAAAPAAARPAALYACWTRKEAHGKAAGTGLVYPLSAVEVWAGDERPVRAAGILVGSLELEPGIAGALALAVGPEEEVALPSVPEMFAL